MRRATSTAAMMPSSLPPALVARGTTPRRSAIRVRSRLADEQPPPATLGSPRGAASACRSGSPARVSNPCGGAESRSRAPACRTSSTRGPSRAPCNTSRIAQSMSRQLRIRGAAVARRPPAPAPHRLRRAKRSGAGSLSCERAPAERARLVYRDAPFHARAPARGRPGRCVRGVPPPALSVLVTLSRADPAAAEILVGIEIWHVHGQPSDGMPPPLAEGRPSKCPSTVCGGGGATLPES